MKNEMIEFYAEDGVALNGYIHKCNSNTDKILIEIHGMASNCFKAREKIISNKVETLNIDSLCFNTRGSEIVKYIRNKNGEKKLAGTAYEDIEECYYDVIGAIKYAINLGYTSIYLQGHSLGATKVVYTYHKLQKENSEYLKYIKCVILLSLIDIPDMIKTFIDPKYIEYANNGNPLELMPLECFINPISVKTFLNYINNKNIDFAQYSNENDNFEVLNSINIPIFMRWGSINELIKRSPKEQAKYMNVKIINNKKDISYIEEADHSYTKKEEILADEIYNFLNNL